MKTSDKIQQVVSKLAAKYGLDLSGTGARLRLDMPGFDRLVIERRGDNLVSVAHCYEQKNHVIANPEIVF